MHIVFFFKKNLWDLFCAFFIRITTVGMLAHEGSLWSATSGAFLNNRVLKVPISRAHCGNTEKALEHLLLWCLA